MTALKKNGLTFPKGAHLWAPKRQGRRPWKDPSAEDCGKGAVPPPRASSVGTGPGECPGGLLAGTLLQDAPLPAEQGPRSLALPSGGSALLVQEGAPRCPRGKQTPCHSSVCSPHGGTVSKHDTGARGSSCGPQTRAGGSRSRAAPVPTCGTHSRGGGGICRPGRPHGQIRTRLVTRRGTVAPRHRAGWLVLREL